jgi:hypothetical protein
MDVVDVVDAGMTLPAGVGTDVPGPTVGRISRVSAHVADFVGRHIRATDEYHGNA